MRFGLIGAGHWAARTHLPALLAARDTHLAGLWGRNADRARALAGAHSLRVYETPAQLIDDVDAVSFAVPPDVQCRLALSDAAAGRHLLLEKPVAFSYLAARELAEEVERTGVSTVVFFTHRFLPEVRAWLAGVQRQPGWAFASTNFLNAALAPGSPFRTPWRFTPDAALWDVGAHALSLLTACLGAIEELTALRTPDGSVRLVIDHHSGASSDAHLTLRSPAGCAGSSLTMWGEAGCSVMPSVETSSVEALRLAVEELTTCASSSVQHEGSGLTLGLEIVRLLERASGSRAPSSAAPDGS